MTAVAYASPSRAAVAPGHLAGLLSLLQLSDSAFPSGRYTLSHGLEAFAQAGYLTAPAHPSTLLELLGDCVRYGVAPSDGVALACAHRAVRHDGTVDLELVTRADARLTAVKISRESREASIRTGRALLTTAAAMVGDAPLAEYIDRVGRGSSPGNHAVAVGMVSAWLGVPRVDGVAGELFAYCISWVAAAVRLALTDYRTAQRLLHHVRPSTVTAALRAADQDVASISSCVPLVDVMAMRHEQGDVRLFAN